MKRSRRRKFRNLTYELGYRHGHEDGYKEGYSDGIEHFSQFNRVRQEQKIKRQSKSIC